MPAAVKQVQDVAECDLQWRPPSKDGNFRVGDFLWSGRSVLQEAPKSAFFPRQQYAALTLPPARRGFGASLLLFGGMQANKCQNDVWRMSVPRLGSQRAYDGSGVPVQPKWTTVSPHEDGMLDGRGRRIMRKWRGRMNFGYSAALSNGGGLLIYVAGGDDGQNSRLNDVWASEDGGAKWVCMTAEAQWGKRSSPALCAVPGRPDHVVLAGGMGLAAQVCEDVWTSTDAGATWVQLERPGWAKYCGRYRSALLPLPAQPGDDETCARLLLFGGCFIDGGEGGYGGFERLMHDAWECKLDLHPDERARAATWTCWGSNTEERGRAWAKVGVEHATCAIEPHSRTIVARLPERHFLCVAPVLPPARDAEAVTWHEAVTAEKPEVLGYSLRDGAPETASMKLIYVRVANAGRQSIPRLVVTSPTNLYLSGDGEWRRQLFYVLLLGLRLDILYGIPQQLWRGRVMPALLPAVLLPAKKKVVAPPPGGFHGTGVNGRVVGTGQDAEEGRKQDGREAERRIREEAERIAREEEARLRRLEEERQRLAAEERRRQVEELRRRQAEEDKRRQEEERRRQEELERRQAEEERKRLEEERRRQERLRRELEEEREREQKGSVFLQQFPVLTIYIDRSLDLTTSVDLAQGMTVVDVKDILARDDPTGQTQSHDFTLSDPRSGRVLGDAELVAGVFAELEVCVGG